MPCGESGGGSGCGFSVRGEERGWEPGKVVIFQNSFQHHTWNRTDLDRTLLYFDFWHPELSADERLAILRLQAARQKHEAEASGNMAMPAHLQSLLGRMQAKRP